MERFSISCGISDVGAITLGSKCFKATATCVERDGIVSISAHVERVRPPSQFAGVFGNFVLVFLTSLSLYVLVGEALLRRATYASEAQSFWKILFWFFWVWNSVMGMLLALRRTRNVAPWHGAEHKVIESYDRLGTIYYDDIKRQSPISDYCGARFFALVFIAGLLSGVALPMRCFSVFGEMSIAMLVLVLGSVLDMPFLRAIGAIAFSRLLQRRTTTEPGEKELATAIAALRALIQAHEYPETVPAPQQ